MKDDNTLEALGFINAVILTVLRIFGVISDDTYITLLVLLVPQLFMFAVLLVLIIVPIGIVVSLAFHGIQIGLDMLNIKPKPKSDSHSGCEYF